MASERPNFASKLAGVLHYVYFFAGEQLQRKYEYNIRNEFRNVFFKSNLKSTVKLSCSQTTKHCWGNIMFPSTGVSTIDGISIKMTVTLGGGVSINCIYYAIFLKVLCLSFCQIPSPYQDSHMQIICGKAVINVSIFPTRGSCRQMKDYTLYLKICMLYIYIYMIFYIFPILPACFQHEKHYVLHWTCLSNVL